MVAQMMAEQIGRAARTDMQLLVPERPVVRHGVRLRRAGDSVVLDGSDRGQAFSGAFARDTLIPLVGLCDGSRSHADLADELDLDETSVFSCLALLFSTGVLEEAPESVPEVEPAWRVFLSRLGNSTGVNASWTTAVERSRSTVVVYDGDPALVAAAREATTFPLGGSTDTGASLVVFFETASGRDRLPEVRDRCWREGTPLLRVRADDDAVVIGPYVDPRLTPCLDCAASADDGRRTGLSARLVDLVVGLALHHVTALATRSVVTHLPGDSVVVDPGTLATRYLPAVSRPGCERCSVARGPLAPTPAGARYEASVAIPPRAFLSPRDHQAHYYSGNLSLQSKFKDWPSRDHTPLPPADLARLAGPVGAAPTRTQAPVTLDTLAVLLKTAFGVNEAETTERRTKRWTAAAGNIGCTTAYLLCRRSGPLPPGIYGYAPVSHSLARVSDVVPPGAADHEIVITGDLTKIMTKYGTFGFRLVFLDAGCAMATLRESGAHLGVEARPLTEWDDDALLAALAGSTTDEPIVAVASLGGVS